MKEKLKLTQISYKRLLQARINKLGVLRDERKEFYRALNRLMAACGVITFESIGEERRKPFVNSPFGKFVQYAEPQEGEKRGKRQRSFVLSEYGLKQITAILNEHVTDKYLTKGKIASASNLEKQCRTQVNGELLAIWLKNRGYKYDVREDAQRITFYINENKYTYYNNSNLVINKDCSIKEMPFTFIFNAEGGALANPQIKGQIVSDIYTAFYNYMYGNEVTTWRVTPSATKAQHTNKINGISEDVLRAMIKQELQQMLQGNVAPCEDAPKAPAKGGRVAVKQTILDAITSTIKPAANANKGYFKSITQENINKEHGRRKEQLQTAFDYLQSRNLVNAVNAPANGWQFDFKTNNIILQYKICKRNSKNYNTKKRLLKPFIAEDGTEIKELCNKGEKYRIPYGVENIDYKYKYIFLTEGIFDSSFIKNCLAYSNWILPDAMCDVVNLFRENGFKIIHILDNFKIGDKGGILGLKHTAQREYIKQGDVVFNWNIYSECKDINEVAIKYNLTEIKPEDIINNTWSEQEIRNAVSVYCIDDVTSEATTDVTSEQEPIAEPTNDVAKADVKENVLSDDATIDAIINQIYSNGTFSDLEQEQSKITNSKSYQRCSYKTPSEYETEIDLMLANWE